MEKVSIFDGEAAIKLFKGSRYLKESCFSTERQKSNRHDDSRRPTRTSFENPDDSFCLTCEVKLSSREEQLEHYKSDWHRYNLKLRLTGSSAVSQHEFEDIINEISSISGSDSSDDEEMKYQSSIDIPKVDKALTSLSLSNVYDDAKSDDYHVVEASRTPKIYLRSSNGMILSFYRSIIPTEFNQDGCDVNIDKVEEYLSRKIKCLIILLSAGHFAACVFDGENVCVHKTFHRYVLRAKQGTVQSVRDGRGNAPKSGGAALRRHNEAALALDIQNLLNSWKVEHIDECTHIFLRTPHYGKGIFYNGKSAPLNRKDTRIKGIPFPSRRPTFNELKRVHKELFSVSVNVEEEPTETVKSDEQTEPTEIEDDPKQDRPTDNGADENDHVNAVSISNKCPQKRKRKKEKILLNDDTEELPSAPVSEMPPEHENDPIIDELFTVCKTGNLLGLKAVLLSLNSEYSDATTKREDVISIHLNQPIDKENDTLLHITAKAGHLDIIQHLLEQGADPAVQNNQGNVPYLVTNDKSIRNGFRKFMASHPDKYDYALAKIPGPLTEDMEKERKQKQNERKKAQKAMKKERTKEQKAVKQKQQVEQQERERFAALSDREKRAIAAERRFAQQIASKNAAIPSNVARCWLCGESLLGKIPFEYYDYQFCSIACLKRHKSQESTAR